jgi:hypothetical protein
VHWALGKALHATLAQYFRPKMSTSRDMEPGELTEACQLKHGDSFHAIEVDANCQLYCFLEISDRLSLVALSYAELSHHDQELRGMALLLQQPGLHERLAQHAVGLP